MNFQIDRGYNVAGCEVDAICWGNDTDDDGWVHYLINGTQLVRCQTDVADTVITDFSACRVLANEAESFSIDYVNSARTATIQLQVTRTSPELGGGALSVAPTALQVQVRLRNPES